MSDRLTSEAAEQAVLGSAMIDAGALRVAQEQGVRGHSFANGSHRVLWEVMEALADSDSAIDTLTLSEALESAGRMADAGGMDYLVELATTTPSAANVESYARIVVDRAHQRQWYQALSRAKDVFLDPQCDDPIGAAEALIAGLDSPSAGGAFVWLRDELRDEIGRIEDKHENPGIRGLQTGYHNIDHRVMGFQGGDLWIVAGRPGMGKTAYALNVIRQVGLQQGQEGVIPIFSLEMSAGSLVQRLIAAQGPIKKDLLRSAKIIDHADSMQRLTTAVHRLRDVPIRICDKSGLTVREIRSLALAEKRRHGVRLVVVDYLGLIEFEGRERSTADQVGDITRTLKRLARELECPVMLLAQLSRKVEDRAQNNRRPVMADLRDSGHIEQDADVIQFLYRDEYYNPDNTQFPGQVEVITAKGRELEIGTDYLKWNGAYQLMESQSIYDQEAAAAGPDWY